MTAQNMRRDASSSVNKEAKRFQSIIHRDRRNTRDIANDKCIPVFQSHLEMHEKFEEVNFVNYLNNHFDIYMQ